MSMREDFAGVAEPKTWSKVWQPAIEALRPAAVPVASKDERKPRLVEPVASWLCAGLHKQDNLLVE
jgi:hypothetical protein